MRVKLERAKSTPKGTFSNWRLNEVGVGKMCVFDGKRVLSRKRPELRLRLLIITNRKLHTPCQIR